MDRYLEGTAAFGNIASNELFPYIIAPGIEVGWYEANPEVHSCDRNSVCDRNVNFDYQAQLKLTTVLGG